MAFDLSDCQFVGPALPEPFVRFELEKELTKLKLLPKTTGADGKQLKQAWEIYRRHLAQLAVRGGPVRVRNHVVEPIVERLGYNELRQAQPVETREGREAGGRVLVNGDESIKIRVWATPFDEDLDAPAKRGQAYRFSHLRIAQRVLLASGERVGLLTNGVELRLLISDPARPDSQVVIPIDTGWKRSRDVPDSFRLLLALASPDGLQAVPDLVDKARLQQARVTKDLREQARQAIGRFIQEVLDHPDNQSWLVDQTDRDQLARDLWHEGLVIVYRLLFVLKLESSDDSARSFTFASTSLWRNTFSPSMALAPFAPQVLHEGAETGGLLEGGLRTLFKMFEEGVECTELNVKPLGGALFGSAATPVLSNLRWGERAVAHLLDQLLWTTPKRKKGARERVHYGPLDVEDLGRVYEALLELEPGIAGEPMCRLRRQKLEVVVPVAQGEKYRPAKPSANGNGDEVDESGEEETPKKNKKTTVQWIEEIPPGRFYLRVGLGRKASGSYYTPHSFVRFLVQETLGPQVAERSPPDDPKPGEILKLKVLDPAMGSGHFLVEACRFLGDHLYEAARACDERALKAEQGAERAKTKKEREAAEAEAQEYRQRVIDLPDPDDEIVRYLPSRSPEGEESGISQRKAEALCRRMVAVHCLYGVDKNPLAVELAKLALWLESHAEGMPLTFLDHRLVLGDSLTGPFWDKLIMRPSDPKEPVEGIFHQGLTLALQNKLAEALSIVRHLEATVGVSLSEIEEKERLKAELDQALRPFRIIAAAWSGGVMLGPDKCDDLAYADLLKSVAETAEIPERIESERLRTTIARGLDADSAPAEGASLYSLLNSARCVPNLPYDLTFPEVFYPAGVPHGRQGFDLVVGNPPWDVPEVNLQEVLGAFDPSLSKDTAGGYHKTAAQILRAYPQAEQLLRETATQREQLLRSWASTLLPPGANPDDVSGKTDLFVWFTLRGESAMRTPAYVGWVIPAAFHLNESGVMARDNLIHRHHMCVLASFDNKHFLFEDLPQVIRFDLVVSSANKGSEPFFRAIFDGRRFDELTESSRWLKYPYRLVPPAGDEKAVVEAASAQWSLDIIADLRSLPTLGEWLDRQKMDFTQELNQSNFGGTWVKICADKDYDASDPRLPEVALQHLAEERLVLYESKTLHIFDDMWTGSLGSKWDPVPTLAAPFQAKDEKYNTRIAHVLRRATYFRIALRESCGNAVTSERSCAGILSRPGFGYLHSAQAEKTPWLRTSSQALVFLAVVNSHFFDWMIRLRIRAHVSKTALRNTAWITRTGGERFFAHSALRLTASCCGYEPLWREQVGDAWREEGKEPLSWPVLAGDDERWEVRAAIDAVVADAYGLSRDQYEHVLSTFSHKSYPKAPQLCLAKFDELQSIGLDTFTRKHDPYHDIPLNENLPQPVIDLPIPEEEEGKQGKLF